MRYHAQPECYLDPGNPPTFGREPGGGGDMDEETNPWDAAVFIKEAFAEVLAGFSEQDLADLARDALNGDELAVGHVLTQEVADYARNQVHDVRMGYAPKPKRRAV